MTEPAPYLFADGHLFIWKECHGAYFTDPAEEAVDSLTMPAYSDGSPALDQIVELDISYFGAAGGPCPARCSLCVAEEARAKEEGWL